MRPIALATRAHASGAWLRCSVFSFNRCNAQSGSAHPTTLPAVKRYARTSRACYGFSAAECRRNREALVWGQQNPQRVPSLAFTIDRKGNVLNSQIAMTSGSAVLDAEVLALINFRARPP